MVRLSPLLVSVSAAYSDDGRQGGQIAMDGDLSEKQQGRCIRATALPPADALAALSDTA